MRVTYTWKYVLWWDNEMCISYKRSSALKTKVRNYTKTHTNQNQRSRLCTSVDASSTCGAQPWEKRGLCPHTHSRPYCAAGVMPAAERNTFGTLSGNVKIIWQFIKWLNAPYISEAGSICQDRRKYWSGHKFSYSNRQGVTSRATAMAKRTWAVMTSIRVVWFVFCVLSVLWLHTRHGLRGCDCPLCYSSSSRRFGSTLESWPRCFLKKTFRRWSKYRIRPPLIT